MLKISFRYISDMAVIDCDGDINVDAANFVEAVGWAISHGYKKIVCNFEEVKMVDYVGVSLIAVAYKNVFNHHGQMRLYNISPHIVKLFSAVGLDQIFDFYVSEDQAVKSFEEDKRIARVMARKLRRRFKRVQVPGVVRYRSQGAFSDVDYTAKIINISAVGVFIDGEHLFPVGEILATSIESDDFIMNLNTRVIWIADSAIQTFERQAMGLEFYHLPSEDQARVIEFVEKYLPRVK